MTPDPKPGEWGVLALQAVLVVAANLIALADITGAVSWAHLSVLVPLVLVCAVLNLVVTLVVLLTGIPGGDD